MPESESENDLRFRLFQEEIDRRFTNYDRLVLARSSGLQVLLDERYATQTKATDAAFVAQQTAMKTAFEAADKAVQAALAAAKEATGKAEAAADKRFEATNEFRQQLADQTATFITRNEYVLSHKATEDKVALNSGHISDLELRLTSRLDNFTGSQKGTREYRQDELAEGTYTQYERSNKAQATRAMITTAIAALSTLVAIVSVLFAVLHK